MSCGAVCQLRFVGGAASHVDHDAVGDAVLAGARLQNAALGKEGVLGCVRNDQDFGSFGEISVFVLWQEALSDRLVRMKADSRYMNADGDDSRR